MKDNGEKFSRIVENVAGMAIIAMPKVTSYKGVNIYLNGEDHRPPHLVATCPNKPRERANFCINNKTDPKYSDGSLLSVSSDFPKDKLKDVKEWFSSVNRAERMEKVMEYILERGEPAWFKVEEIFTSEELAEYCRRKEEKSSKSKSASVITALKEIDLSKPWSRENDYDMVTEIRSVVANDDYTLSVSFADGSKKTYDVKDRIFDKSNKDYRWFGRLKDINEFKKAEECGWAVRWDDDTDISSYELYVNGK